MLNLLSMITVSDEQFKKLVADAMDRLKKQFAYVKNVAIIVEDEPSLQQREQLHLVDGQTLYGLYEGVPMSQRQGTLKILPDKITLFKKPLEFRAQNLVDLAEAVRHTLWHEVGHYYGLDHNRIHELESK